MNSWKYLHNSEKLLIFALQNITDEQWTKT